MQRLLRLIENGRVDPNQLTTHTFPFAELDKAFTPMETKADGIIKPMITFQTCFRTSGRNLKEN